MELRLNIYDDKDELVKEYTKNSYSLKMRQLKDVIETLDLESLAEALTTKGDSAGLVASVGKMVAGSYDTVKNLIMDIFPDVTEKEYENTHLDEVAKLVVNIVKYSFNVIGLAGGTGKN